MFATDFILDDGLPDRMGNLMNEDSFGAYVKSNRYVMLLYILFWTCTCKKHERIYNNGLILIAQPWPQSYTYSVLLLHLVQNTMKYMTVMVQQKDSLKTGNVHVDAGKLLLLGIEMLKVDYCTDSNHFRRNSLL